MNLEKAIYHKIKEEVIVKEVKHKIGKLIIDHDNQTMTIISGIINLTDIQNTLFELHSESEMYIPSPFAGDNIIPGDWTIIFKIK